VAKLSLDDVQGNALAGELDCVGVAELMRREATAHTGLNSKSVELEPARRRLTTPDPGWGRR
jgi:hypothetical protein